ncbi:MAG: PAS domain S-box protein [Anaerolineales bacterium]|nr:PAS domain S-box protein [Anaerolineales bacterium]
MPSSSESGSSAAADASARSSERSAVERDLIAAFDALPAHIAILDETGAILAVNRAWRKFSEENGPLRTNVCEGANYLAVCAAVTGPEAAQAAAVAEGMRDVIGGRRREFTFEYACDAPQQARWFTTLVTRLADEGPVRLLMLHENNSVQHQREQARAILAAIVDSSKDAIFSVDLDGKITSWNRTAELIYGRTADEVIGTNFLPWLAADQTTDLQSILERLRHSETVQLPDLEWQKPVGEHIVLAITLGPVHGGDGVLTGFASIARDVTARFRAEAATHASELKYRDLYDHSPDMYLSGYPADQLIRDCNLTLRALVTAGRN